MTEKYMNQVHSLYFFTFKNTILIATTGIHDYILITNKTITIKH